MFTRQSTKWWLISRHKTLGIDAFAFGPFRSEERARAYPATLFGWADGPAFGADFVLRAIELP